MRKIDISDIRKEAKEGKLRVHVNVYGYIQIIDVETGEMVVIGNMGGDE